MNTSIIWKGKAKDWNGWSKAMLEVYGKEETLENVIKDLKSRRIQRQLKYIKENYEK